MKRSPSRMHVIHSVMLTAAWIIAAAAVPCIAQTTHYQAHASARMSPVHVFHSDTTAAQLTISLQPAMEIIEGYQLIPPEGAELITACPATQSAEIVHRGDTVIVSYHSPLLQPAEDTLGLSLRFNQDGIYPFSVILHADSASVSVDRAVTARTDPVTGGSLLEMTAHEPLNIVTRHTPGTLVAGESGLTWRFVLTHQGVSGTDQPLTRIRFRPPSVVQVPGESVVSVTTSGGTADGVFGDSGYWVLDSTVQPGDSAVINCPADIVEGTELTPQVLVTAGGLQETAVQNIQPVTLLEPTLNAVMPDTVQPGEQLPVRYELRVTGSGASVHIDSLILPVPVSDAVTPGTFAVEDVRLNGSPCSAGVTVQTDSVAVLPDADLTAPGVLTVSASFQTIPRADGSISFETARAVMRLNDGCERIVSVAVPTDGTIILEENPESLARLSVNAVYQSGPDATPLRIGYLGEEDRWFVAVYSLRGERVFERRDPSADMPVVWDGTNDDGEPVASGYYVVRIWDGTRQEVCRVVVIR